MSVGLWVLGSVLVALGGFAGLRGQDPGPVIRRLVEQLARLGPKILLAFLAAGFVAELIPEQAIARYLGSDAGLLALPVAAATGLIVPAGPVVAFAIAAVFARAGASTPALVTFITSWTIFAMHRILVYELPLLGPSFLRLRAVSALAMPFVAGLLAMLAGLVSSFGAAMPPR